jgi:hypothetical protein
MPLAGQIRKRSDKKAHKATDYTRWLTVPIDNVRMQKTASTA